MKQAMGWIVGCLCIGTWAVGAVTAEPAPSRSVERWSQLLGRTSEAIAEARGGILSLPPLETARVISSLLQSAEPHAHDEGIWLVRRAPDAAVLLFGELIEWTRSEDEVTRGTALRALSTLAPAAASAGHPIIKVLLPHLQEGGACSVFAFTGLIALDLIHARALDASHAPEVFEGLMEYDGLLHTPLAKTPSASKEILDRRHALVVSLLRANDAGTRVRMLKAISWFVKITKSPRAFMDWRKQISRCLSHESLDVQMAALEVVGRYRACANRYFYDSIIERIDGLLVAMILGPDRVARSRALAVVAAHPLLSSKVPAALTETLLREDASANELAAAAWALRDARNHDGTIAALEHSLRSGYFNVRSAAWAALVHLDVIRPTHVSHVVEFLRYAGRRGSRGSPVRISGAWMHKTLPRYGKPLVDALARRLRVAEGDLRFRWIRALADCGPLGVVALREMELPLDVVHERIERLGPLHMVPEADMAALFADLKHDDRGVAYGALSLLKKVPLATDELVRLALSADSKVLRSRARVALKGIGSWAKPAIKRAIQENPDAPSELESLLKQIR